MCNRKKLKILKYNLRFDKEKILPSDIPSIKTGSATPKRRHAHVKSIQSSSIIKIKTLYIFIPCIIYIADQRGIEKASLT